MQLLRVAAKSFVQGSSRRMRAAAATTKILWFEEAKSFEFLRGLHLQTCSTANTATTTALCGSVVVDGGVGAAAAAAHRWDKGKINAFCCMKGESGAAVTNICSRPSNGVIFTDKLLPRMTPFPPHL